MFSRAPAALRLARLHDAVIAVTAPAHFANWGASGASRARTHSRRGECNGLSQRADRFGCGAYSGGSGGFVGAGRTGRERWTADRGRVVHEPGLLVMSAGERQSRRA